MRDERVRIRRRQRGRGNGGNGGKGWKEVELYIEKKKDSRLLAKEEKEETKCC